MGNSNSGRGGLPPAVRREIERRLAAGQEANVLIARSCGVNVSTVQRIKRRVAVRAAQGAEEEEVADTVRCGTCGGSVKVAFGYCLACYQEKTIFAPARRGCVARLAARRANRSQKARAAA